MNKFLFTDGVNGIREVQSLEELHALAGESNKPADSRIWVFGEQEWISYPDFRKQFPLPVTRGNSPAIPGMVAGSKRRSGKKVFMRIFFAALLVGGAFTVFNFSSEKVEKADPLQLVAPRPANMPVMDMDSLISEIEWERDRPLDKSTRSNLRLRNTWPEKIFLQLNSQREKVGNGFRFFDIRLSIDNATGLNLDQAVARWQVWKNRKLQATDTMQFRGIGFDKSPVRKLAGSYRGDSLAVFFELIHARAFNFCYDAGVQNNSGNYNDRWFCRETVSAN